MPPLAQSTVTNPPPPFLFPAFTFFFQLYCYHCCCAAESLPPFPTSAISSSSSPRDSSSRRPTLARRPLPAVATLLRTRHLVVPPSPPLLSRGGVSSGTGSIASAGEESLEQAQTKLVKVQWTDTSGKETLLDRDKLQRLLWPWFCSKCWRGVSLKEVQPWKLINKSVNRKGLL